LLQDRGTYSTPTTRRSTTCFVLRVNRNSIGCIQTIWLAEFASSGSKKSLQSDSDNDSEDEVRDGLPFLCQDNEQLSLLLDNRDDMLREAKKLRKELRTSL
jgi:hypothetical protein